AKFQAVQHMLATMAGHVATARAAADQAVEAERADAPGPSALRVAIAKSRTGEAAGRGAEIVHQVLGAIGFTREHSLHYQTRRLWAWRDEFGNETWWQQRLGREVAKLGADALWPTIVELEAARPQSAARPPPVVPPGRRCGVDPHERTRQAAAVVVAG